MAKRNLARINPLVLLICFSLIACTIPDYIEETTEEVVQEQEDDEPIVTVEYINDRNMHIPVEMYGEYEYNGQTWGLASAGIISPINYLLYPNPVTSASFLDYSGETIEKIGDGYYSFFGKAMFGVYEGACKVEIIQ